MGVVVEALDGRLFERSVHAFDLTVGPWMTRLGEAMIDTVLGTGIFEGVHPKLLALIHCTADVGCGGGQLACRTGVFQTGKAEGECQGACSFG